MTMTDFNPSAKNDVYRMPEMDAVSDVAPAVPAQDLGELVRQDYAALEEEAARHALSSSSVERLGIVRPIQAAEIVPLSPYVQELRRVSQSLEIMQDRHADQLIGNLSLRIKLASIGIIAFGKRADESRKKLREMMIDEEKLLSVNAFIKEDGTSFIPDDEVWHYYQTDGHWYWVRYDKNNPDQAVSTVHYNLDQDAPHKTETRLGHAQLIHEPVSERELKDMAYFAGKLENVVAQKIYFPKEPRHRRSRN